MEPALTEDCTVKHPLDIITNVLVINHEPEPESHISLSHSEITAQQTERRAPRKNVCWSEH